MASGSKPRSKPLVYQPHSFPEELQTLIDDQFTVIRHEELEKYEKDIVAIFVHIRPKITRELLDRLSSVKVVGNCAVGYNNVDVVTCRERGIRIGYTPDVLNDSTADMGVALLLGVARRLVEGSRMTRDPSFKVIDTGWFGHQVSTTTVGIVGMGRIGLQIAKRLRGFDMTILYHNRRPSQTEHSVGATYVSSLEDMLPLCDYVILVAPATEETRHMMGEKQFSAMKRSGIFVNISRGSLVDQDALVNAIETKQIAAAGLDVTDPEPLPRDHPLLGYPNVTITPHTGSATLHTRRKMVQLTIDNIWAGLKDAPMPAELFAT